MIIIILLAPIAQQQQQSLSTTTIQTHNKMQRNLNQKPQSVQKPTLIYKQPLSQDLQTKQPNRINFPKSITTTPNNTHKDRMRNLQFENNPLIVTRRNISTAQGGRSGGRNAVETSGEGRGRARGRGEDFDPDQEDLMFTSMNLRKGEEPRRPIGARDNRQKQVQKKYTQRPHSKQQPRNKLWNNSQILIKTTMALNDRPLTSKGQRPKLLQRSGAASKAQQGSQGGKRKISLGNQQTKVESMRARLGDQVALGGVGVVGTKNTSKLFFKNCIDAEFLSLFAN